MGKLVLKSGVDFDLSIPGIDRDRLAPAGARILEVLKQIAAPSPLDITITSAADGTHSGPADPHHSGEAFDVRTHGLSPEQIIRFLGDIRIRLGGRFYAFVEDPNGPNEHIHIQKRKGTVYTMLNYLAND